MQIIDYKHIHGTELRPGYVAIPELHRYKSSVQQFIKLADLDIVLTKKTAFLYVDGFSVSQAESGICKPVNPAYQLALKTGSSYIAHEWAGTFKNKELLEKVDIISSTCAAGVQAIYEASELIYSTDIEEVIIIGGERTTDDTIRLFRELRIDVNCGDGFFYMRLAAGEQISNINWKYVHNQNPFYFAKADIDKLKPVTPVDYVKLHGTGTASNTEAESGIAELGKQIMYKHQIGHTQGISALLETCMVLSDDSIQGKIMVAANGLGGFYGSFILDKQS